MLKRIFFVSVFILFGMVLAGCDGVQDLSDEETTLIAEYAADLLLRYDADYTHRIAEGERAAEEMIKEGSDVDDASTDKGSEDEEDKEKSDDKEQSDEQLENSEQQGGEGAKTGNEKDIAKFAGIDGVSITYKDYQIVSRYPEDDNGDALVTLNATSGYELLVLRFTVSNQTDKAIDISLLDKEMDYRIVCNEDKTANAMLTILLEDLRNLETTVNPQEEQEAVLVFQISSTMKNTLKSIELYVNDGVTDNQINIL